jgi:F-type H+-transporting ATPase subunit b
MFNEKFWLAVSFTAFIVFIIKYVGPMILKALDHKSQQIAAEILAAKELREKAAKLLAKTEKYQKDSEQYAQKLIKDAEAEAQKFAIQSREAAEIEIAKKTAAALERIKMEEASAIREIKTKIISSALHSLNDSLGKEISMKDHGQLIFNATDNLKKVVH